MAHNADILAAALSLTKEHGWPVFPTRLKIPLIKKWPELATTDESQIREWETRFKNCNFSLVTGKRSGTLVLDEDIKNDGPGQRETLEAIYGDLPLTPTAITGSGGRHRYFKYPPGRNIKNEVSFAPGLDIRTTGGQVVLPPGLHESGNCYRWAEGLSPDEIELADAPEWLLAMMEAASRTNKGPAPPVEGTIPEGMRNNTMTSLAGSMRQRGFGYDEILAALTVTNENRCDPPLSDGELKNIIKSVVQYKPGDEFNEPVNVDNSIILHRPDTETEIRIEWGVKDMYPRGYVSLIVADPKGGKTWLSMRQATEISVGGKILDGLTWAKPCRIIYFMGDTGPQLVNYRLRQTGWPFNPDLLSFVYKSETMKQGLSLDLGTAEGFNLFEHLIKTEKPGIVFIDTLTSFHTLDENDNSAMKNIIEKLSMLAHKTQTAIVVLHHARKKKRSEYSVSMTQHDSVGAGVLNRLVGCMIGIEKKAGENGQDVFNVRSLQSWFKGFQTFNYTLVDEIDEAGREWVQMKIDLAPAFDKNAKDHIKHVIMENYSEGSEFTRQDVMNLTGLSRTAVSQVLKVMVAQGELSANGTTRDRTFQVSFAEDDFLN